MPIARQPPLRPCAPARLWLGKRQFFLARGAVATESASILDWSRSREHAMKRTISSLLFLLVLLGFAGNGFAAPNPPCTKTAPVPCKILRIFNNNPAGGSNIYAFFESFIQDPLKADLWMQAFFNLPPNPKVTDWTLKDNVYVSDRKFVTTRIRRGYIQIGSDVEGNGDGIAPGTSVDIVIPFHTQLLTTTDANLGKIPDQYIDWWNSGRIYFFDTPAAYHSAKVTNANNDKTPGGKLPPPPVKVLAGAAVPSCTSSTGSEMQRNAVRKCNRTHCITFRSNFRNIL